MVDEGLVRRCVAEEMGRRLEAKGERKTPEYRGPDEFSVRRWRLYYTGICNFDEGAVMEVVEGQGEQRVREYLDKPAQSERAKGVRRLRYMGDTHGMVGNDTELP